MTNYATISDLTVLVRPLETSETDKANLLLEAASARLRSEASRRGKDFDEMLSLNPDLCAVARNVVCDMVRRALTVDVTQEPMTQVSQSALGYSVSATYAVPGGSLYPLNSELKALGLTAARVSVLEPYGVMSC